MIEGRGGGEQAPSAKLAPDSDLWIKLFIQVQSDCLKVAFTLFNFYIMYIYNHVPNFKMYRLSF